MSYTIKLGLLALVSSAAAVPHYAHQRHHRKRAEGTGSAVLPAYPTGGFNATGAAYPTAVGTGSPADPETTVLNTSFLTETIISTIYATRTRSSVPGVPAASSFLPLDATGDAVCAPETVRVTATEKVTVTVSAVPSPSQAPASSAAVPSEPPVPSVAVPSEAAATSPAVSSNAPTTSAAPIPIDIATPIVSSTANSTSAAPEPSTSQASTTEAVVASSSAPYGKRAPQDWSNINYDFSNVDWSKVDYNAPAPAPVPAPAPEPAPAPASASADPKPADPAPEPVSQPSSSNGPSYSGSKRGLAYNDLSLVSSFSGDKIGFAYNWAQAENGALPDGVQFIPMMHKTSDSTAEAFLANVDKAVEKGTTAVMTFNEPDHAAQANMSPEAACDAWSSYVEPITSSHPNVEIMSPSVTNGPAPMGLDWLSRFQKNCPGATWHSANIHFYDIYDDQTFERFKAHVELSISTFNKPVWITEFGLNPGSATSEQAASFLKQAIAYLDGNASVKGYAWFMVGTDTSFNMLNAGTGLSATGEVYAST